MSTDSADLALFRVDPLFAIELGYEAPRCTVCDGDIVPDEGWDGTTPLRHLLSCACDWVKDGTIPARLSDRVTL